MKKFLLAFALAGTQFATSVYAADECPPAFGEAQPKFTTGVSVWHTAYRQVELGGTAVVTVDGVTYDCWNENGTPVMRARPTVASSFRPGFGISAGVQIGNVGVSTCVGGNCGGNSSTGSYVPISRTGWFRR